MQRDTLLTQDELEFIQNMQHNPKLNVRDTSRSLLVNGGVQIHELLTRLAAHEQVTLQAQFENQQMTFPLHLVEDEFHAMHLQLGAPSIYEEKDSMSRPWRLSLPEPLPLRTEKGSQSAMWVHEISFKGVLVEHRKATKPPHYFSLWFCPAGHAPIALRGTFERLTDQGLAAYRLSQRNKEGTELLRQYILQQHQLVHPAPLE
ncbi:hypothetical protein QN386_19530 [Pseudomonas sp. CCI3.2]|uniref:hypothetical protein n=1 Tax=unclassified Pseudomonas TaxID=196821 RepID=UPI002AC982BF|nr:MULTISPECIES: hypothetical protein [unclassified Pseudomonas]MEB0079911.1 hypothetical protein [Pseudomonas sp. MH10out]MEB0093808.1 hypothetical protein [Pseudomonas sp. CCI4.2]MEB0103499.1 hypothetical protein [Pseudomonas sp. CCI3.2]MEB0133472.1 hypothetical protein [Pseudomonas sp. CCI2.4]MEB0159833.1 hypothetical protein [Pseudomonas sp. AH2 (2023)]